MSLKGYENLVTSWSSLRIAETHFCWNAPELYFLSGSIVKRTHVAAQWGAWDGTSLSHFWAAQRQGAHLIRHHPGTKIQGQCKKNDQQCLLKEWKRQTHRKRKTWWEVALGYLNPHLPACPIPSQQQNALRVCHPEDWPTGARGTLGSVTASNTDSAQSEPSALKLERVHPSVVKEGDLRGSLASHLGCLHKCWCPTFWSKQSEIIYLSKLLLLNGVFSTHRKFLCRNLSPPKVH